MTSAEFYRKTSDIFKEFKNREMNLLLINSQSSSHSRKSELSTEEYLQQIENREKDADLSYKKMIRQIHSLDEKSNSMLQKLEKLGVLQNFIMTSTLSSGFAKNYTSNHDSISERGPFTIPPNNSFLKKTATASTQTDDLFCGQCHFPVLSEKNLHVEESNKFLQSQQQSHIDTTPSHSHLNAEKTFSSLDNKLRTDSFSHVSYSTDKSIPTDSHNSVDNSTNNHLLAEKQIHGHPVLENKTNNSIIDIKHLPINKDLYAVENLQTFQDEVGSTKSQNQDSKTNETSQSSSTPNANRTFAKSDRESINHEFNFLESEKINSFAEDHVVISPSKKNAVIDNLPNTSNTSLELVTHKHEASASREIASSADVTNEEKQSTKHHGDLTVTDTKSDSSPSRDHHSSSIKSRHDSIASDSDSSFKKETPLTASAGYQALLGNSVPLKSVEKSDSDSDSDDVENALKTAVRRSSKLIPDLKQKPQKLVEDKEFVPEPKPTIASRRSSAVTSSRPQSKLSKSTRIVLGLDASSGSEADVDLKSSSKQVEEDSDEFYS